MTKGKSPPLHILMLAGFVIGLVAGLWVNLYIGPETDWVQSLVKYVTGPIGKLFLNLLFMLVLPLLFSALVVGVAEMGDLSALGRVGIKTLALTIVVSAIAVVIGLGMVNWLKPGAGVDAQQAQQLLAQGASAASGI